MGAGEYSKRITFERRAPGLNGIGIETGEWEPIGDAWAAIRDLSGREFFGALQVQAEVSTIIRCRYSSCFSHTLTEKDRIRLGDTYFDIRAILGLHERGKEVTFMCTVHSIQ